MTPNELEAKRPGEGNEFGTFEPPRRIEYNVKIEPAETYIYSNVAGVSIAPWDIRINFAEVQPRGDDVISRTVAGIVMPPEHAVALALTLMQQLRIYEKQFGLIRHPAWAALREGFDEADAEALKIAEGLSKKSG